LNGTGNGSFAHDGFKLGTTDSCTYGVAVALVPAAAELARREAEGEDLYLDWVHPNAEGYRIIADLLVPVLAGLLADDHAAARVE
jgi:lysophospholipase L1-like esterase